MKSFFMKKEYDSTNESKKYIVMDDVPVRISSLSYDEVSKLLDDKDNNKNKENTFLDDSLNVTTTTVTTAKQLDLGRKFILEQEVKDFVETHIEDLKLINLFQLIYFRCFDKGLRDCLISKGYSYNWIMIEPSSGDKYWIFLRSNGLNDAVKEFNESKKCRK